MYQIVHGTAGILIGSQTGNPWLAFLFGILSHFILDAIPHDNMALKRWEDKGNFIKKMALEAAIDLWLLIVMVWVLQASQIISLDWPIAAGMLGAILPDYIWGLAELFRVRSKWLERYKRLHSLDEYFKEKVYYPVSYAVTVQLGTLIILLALYVIL